MANLSTGPPRVVLCADAARWGSRRCLGLVARLAPVAPPGTLGIWDRDPVDAAGATRDGERLQRLEQLRALTQAHGHLLTVGARSDLAATVGADGVHLPEYGPPVSAVRESFPTLIVSRSCHDRVGLQAAQTDGAAWATLSPFNPPRSKETHRRPLGEGGFSRAIQGLSLPVFALGGLSVEDILPCKRAGARGVAVSGALFDSETPEGLLRAILRAWREAL